MPRINRRLTRGRPHRPSLSGTRKTSRGHRLPMTPSSIQINGDLVSRKNGWTVIEIDGPAYERGFAHGALLSQDLARLKDALPFLVKTDFKTTLDEYVSRCRRLFHRNISTKYREYYDEIRGISSGAKEQGVEFPEDLLIAWNAFLSMHGEYYDPTTDHHRRTSRCSAFIATGTATQKGDLVMSHNTHCQYSLAPFSNIIIYLTPEKGQAFCMQTCPGLICSSMDWFLCKNGIVGCETTISGINYKPVFGTPYFCRIRECMQYANSLDEYAETMLRDNAGDYACSWLFGDTRTGEIMLCEIGLKTHHIEKTKNGVFYGMNSAIDPVLRHTETTDNSFYDLSKSSGARNARLEYLLQVKYAGKINVNNAKRILADHYDVYLEKDRRGIRGICRHTEQEPDKTNRPPFYPHGAIDGKVITTSMAKRMTFLGKFWASCSRTFSVSKYIKQHPEYAKWREYLVDLPNRPWTHISY